MMQVVYRKSYQLKYRGQTYQDQIVAIDTEFTSVEAKYRQISYPVKSQLTSITKPKALFNYRGVSYLKLPRLSIDKIPCF